MPPGMKVKIASGFAAAILASSAEKSSWPSGVNISSTTSPLKWRLKPASESLPAW